MRFREAIFPIVLIPVLIFVTVCLCAPPIAFIHHDYYTEPVPGMEVGCHVRIKDTGAKARVLRFSKFGLQYKCRVAGSEVFWFEQFEIEPWEAKEPPDARCESGRPRHNREADEPQVGDRRQQASLARCSFPVRLGGCDSPAGLAQ